MHREDRQITSAAGAPIAPNPLSSWKFTLEKWGEQICMLAWKCCALDDRMHREDRQITSATGAPIAPNPLSSWKFTLGKWGEQICMLAWKCCDLYARRELRGVFCKSHMDWLWKNGEHRLSPRGSIFVLSLRGSVWGLKDGEHRPSLCDAVSSLLLLYGG
jgi:hypothetical protein